MGARRAKLRAMKVLVASVPASGHLLPLLPIARALAEGGDEVLVACGPDMAHVVEGTGLGFAPVGRPEVDWFADLGARIRGNPGDGLAPGRINHYFVPRLFGEIGADDMIDELLATAREFRPDLLVFETYAFAAPLAAEVLGVPAVHHLLGPMFPLELMALVDDAVSPLWRQFGCDTPGQAGVYRDVTIEVCPPSLEALEVPSGRRLQLRPAPLPEASPPPSPRPLVYVTLGTLFGWNLDPFRAAIDALAEEPVEVIVTVGNAQDPALLDPLPANTRVERFIPQAGLLPACAAVIHHGGCGTTFGALAHGLPQVVLPQGADNFINGDILARAGAAVTLLPGEVGVESIRAGVREVLGVPSYSAAARLVAAEIAGMPGPAEVADALRR